MKILKLRLNLFMYELKKLNTKGDWERDQWRQNVMKELEQIQNEIASYIEEDEAKKELKTSSVIEVKNK